MFATIYAAILPNIPMLLVHQTVNAKKKGFGLLQSWLKCSKMFIFIFALFSLFVLAATSKDASFAFLLESR